jgi:hypothetical protein
MIRNFLLAAALVSPAAFSGEPVSIQVDPDRVTVSGISAGGQMAHQVHIAYSDIFSGAAILAAGPFNCAEGNLTTAMTRCMGSTDGSYSVADHAAAIRAGAEDGRLADPAALANDSVWIFHGTQDSTVAAGLSELTAGLYGEFVPEGQIVYVSDIPAAHVFPADGMGNDCSAMVPPFVGDCGYDAAGQLLQFLYPDLETPAGPAETGLTEVSLAGAADAGLSETAYLFIPPACAGGQQSCALHLVLHGCAQSAVQVGAGFMEQSGYLPWAEANDIVLAFPQVVPGPANPYACWDWWGYTGPDYLYRDGAQMAVLANWINGFE